MINQAGITHFPGNLKALFAATKTCFSISIAKICFANFTQHPGFLLQIIVLAPDFQAFIHEVQEFLTVCGEDRVYQIVNVELLLRRHPPEAVIGFLNLLRDDYKKELKQIIQKNKTDPRINELVAKNFRIRMAINTIKNAEKGVKNAA